MSKKDKNISYPHISLFGDELENFYQLGLHDRERHSLLLEHASGLFRSRREPINKVLKQLLQTVIGPSLELHPRFKRRISAYAEGLGRRPQEVAMGLLIPELMSFMDKWIPGIPHTLLGCSSVFIWDQKRDALVHGRTLDFPFHNSFDTHERAMHTQLGDGPSMMSFSSAGFPYPSITTMTEDGITFALHQKFGRTFDYQGTPIFDLIYEMLQNCSTVNEVLDFLKHQKSITSWGFYMGFKDGQVLSYEIDGDQHHHSLYQATPDKPLYFCNQREKEELISHEVLPFGFQLYNEMRMEMKERKLKSLGFTRTKEWSAETLIRYIGTADEQQKSSSQDWLADPMNPAALQNIAMIPATEEALIIPEQAPKFFTGEVIQLESAFEKPSFNSLKIRGKTNTPSYRKGVFHFMQAQVAQDKGEVHELYHQIQLSIEYLKENPMGTIAEFYFLVFQYMHEDHRKVLSQILRGFKELEDRLPPYLQDHNTLFIARLEKILKGQSSVGIEEIKHMSLQRVFEFERKMPKVLFHHITKELMSPRLDLLDVFYPHVKA